MTSVKQTTTGKTRYFWLVFVGLCVLFVVGCYCSLRFGSKSYSHDQVWQTLSRPLVSNALQDIIIDIRLPRLLAAILVGAGMASSGSVMQGITRNAIADPGLLGINAGAGFALALGYAFLPSIHYGLILLISFLGAVLAALLVFGISYKPGQGYHQLRLILSGAMVAVLFSAIGEGITIYFRLSESIIGWQAGGLAGLNWKMLLFIAPAILIGLCLLQFFAHQLNILSLNETVAKALGQRTFLMTLSLMGLVLLMSAAAVALVGAISFVGLFVPHAIHFISSKDYRYRLPMMALAGGTVMIWFDLLSRSLRPPSETPLGTIVSLVGIPAFLWLLRKEKHL